MKITVFTEEQPLYIIQQQTNVETFTQDVEVTPVSGDGGTIPGNDGSGYLLREVLTVTVEGQKIFQLSGVPSTPQGSRLFVNGLKALYVAHYIIDGALLKWLESTYSLSPTDYIEVFY